MRGHVALAVMIVGCTLALGPGAWAQNATDLKKELFLKYKRAQAVGTDLGEAGKEYKAGDEALKKGLQDEAVEHFTRAMELWPADAN